MPAKTLKAWAKESNTTVETAEKHWNECKHTALGKGLQPGTESYWAYVNTCTRGKLELLKKDTKDK